MKKTGAAEQFASPRLINRVIHSVQRQRAKVLFSIEKTSDVCMSHVPPAEWETARMSLWEPAGAKDSCSVLPSTIPVISGSSTSSGSKSILYTYGAPLLQETK